MDLTILLSLCSGLIIIILIFFLLRERRKSPIEEPLEEDDEQRPVRRGVAQQRNVRARLRAAAAQQAHQTIEEEEDGDLEKLGAKKRAKMEAKAEKKAIKEIEEREREEKKKRKELEEIERKKQEEQEKLEEQKREEEERKAREEKARQEHEEYLKLKATFNIEEEGFDDTEIESDNILQDFISHIKNTKVLLLEDLASKFHMKTQSVINRIHELQAEKRLTGIIDDRGKFIYISQEELEAVAKFVKQRGRVSIAELAENSNVLINLNPNIAVES